MSIFITIFVIILLIALSSSIYKILPFNLPLPFIQIILGAVVSWPSNGFHVTFDPELFMLLFIPPLLFEDGRKMPLREFFHSGREIISLALVLVFVTVVGLGYVIYFFMPEMSLPVAFALAAILSPTDAVALSSIVGKGRLSHRLMQVLEGEALMNDASALVSLKFAIAVALGITALSTAHDYAMLSLTFLKMAVGGILVGIAFTWLYVQFILFLGRLQNDEMGSQMILIMLLPFGSYAIAELLEFSGILSAVAAGMTLGYSKLMQNTPVQTRIRANNVWGLLEYLLNGAVFLMLGLQIPGIFENAYSDALVDPSTTFTTLLGDIVLIYLALMLLRFLWVALLRLLSPYTPFKKPMSFASMTFKELLILTFSGVRGTVTLSAALSIPLLISTNPDVPFPARYQVIFLSAGIIILSLVTAALVLPILLRKKKSANDIHVEVENNREEQEIRSEIATAAIDAVKSTAETLLNKAMKEQQIAAKAKEEQKKEGIVDIEDNPDKSEEELNDEATLFISQIMNHVISEIEQVNHMIEKTKETDAIEVHMRLAAVRAERRKLFELKSKNRLSAELYANLLYELDLAEALILGRSPIHPNN
ncbi:Na+/H+ antiporter [Ignatzschineria ureiclastica]|uniref:Na+/H+ antiporter n=1 Tax=Ignatzschineria ureiclastica TaxID=472582 RepID=A0A2U2AFT3_9GAMM|nr:Na+/H+ antiporter [Ignatzschineria ureiclastica]PWD81528.1 Na+/H+ antiporter [Ignatzschineria ureiclastica]GHA01389.1 sodium/hydrogen exchanger family protein [Ignatzschineria ureiclastica]